MQGINRRREPVKGFIFSIMLGTIALSAPALASNVQQQDAQTIKIEQWANSNPDEFNAFTKKCSENKTFMLENMRSCNIAVSYRAEQLAAQYQKEAQNVPPVSSQ